MPEPAPIWTARACSSARCAPPYPTHPPAPGPSEKRPSAGRATRGGRLAAGACLVLGIVLFGGALAGRWLSGSAATARSAAQRIARAYAETRELWHGVPANTLFPPTVTAAAGGPGGADRTWIRVGVAPDSGCDGAFEPALAHELAPVGCLRLLRATYTDSTSSDVTTVGLLVTRTDPAGMASLEADWTARDLGDDTSMMPRPVPFPGTDSAGFGLAQRASWEVRFSKDLPAVVYAVSGFADGRTVDDPQPADTATVPGATSDVAQAGLGFDAQGLTNAVWQRLTATVTALSDPSGPPAPAILGAPAGGAA